MPGTAARHSPALAFGLLAPAALAAAVAGTALPQLNVLVIALALGAAFILLDYGFALGFRALLQDGDGRTLAATFAVPAVAALVVLPVGATAEGYQRWVAPIGPSLFVGAAIFGVGMMLANGCGSGALVAAGQGARRMLVALPFFCLGGVAGSLAVPTTATWPGIAVDLAAPGPWLGLLVTEALIAAAALMLLRGRRPDPRRLAAGAVIGALAAAMFLVQGQPWGITMALTAWGARAVQSVGADVAATAFWSEPWAAALLTDPLTAIPGSIANAGVLAGAFCAAAATGAMRHRAAIGLRGAIGGALGGLLMGFGARLSFGCNVGAFLGGISSGSLHGFAWVVAVLPGCWLGLRLRPFFGYPAPASFSAQS